MLDFSFEVSTKSHSSSFFGGQTNGANKIFCFAHSRLFLYSQQKLVTSWGIIDDLMNKKKGPHKSS
jgi:hypothetical protein